MPKTYPFQPDYRVAPGATLRETLRAKGLTQAGLALRMGMSQKTISQIVNGVAPISYRTAYKLEMVLGIPARFWNAREARYRHPDPLTVQAALDDYRARQEQTGEEILKES